MSTQSKQTSKNDEQRATDESKRDCKLFS
jgi:hypothetical protein